MRGYIHDYQIRRERIFMNVPPATVRHLRFQTSTAENLVQPSALLQF